MGHGVHQAHHFLAVFSRPVTRLQQARLAERKHALTPILCSGKNRPNLWITLWIIFAELCFAPGERTRFRAGPVAAGGEFCTILASDVTAAQSRRRACCALRPDRPNRPARAEFS